MTRFGCDGRKFLPRPSEVLSSKRLKSRWITRCIAAYQLYLVKRHAKLVGLWWAARVSIPAPWD
jgi:hypothetical protein